MKRSRLSEHKFRAILKAFCIDMTAQDTATLTDISRYTINTLFEQLRYHLVLLLKNKQESIEDPCLLFGASWTRQKKGARHQKEIVPVFGIRKEETAIVIDWVANCTFQELKPMIQGKRLDRTRLDTDQWKPYLGIILNGYGPYPLYHQERKYLPAEAKKTRDDLLPFWLFVKKRLTKFQGIADTHFFLHLKETTCRFNYRRHDIYPLLLKHLKAHPLQRRQWLVTTHTPPPDSQDTEE